MARAGTLRRRVTIQERAGTRDTSGQPTDIWNPVATVWGEVEDLSSAELLSSGGFSAQVTTRIRIRHRTGISSGMRIVTGARTFEIVGPPIDTEGRRRMLEIPCKEITP